MAKMKTVKVEYSVRFRTLVNVPVDADDISDIDIPENHASVYVPDSFEVALVM